jgi:ubiquinone/menaquinone biosynthesis C-methylase UbiE
MSVMDEINVKGLVCLEAGTGAGNTTLWLAKKGAKLVYSISNNQEHLDYAFKRLSKKYIKNVKFIKADLQKLDFLEEETIDLITAHMLINVVTPVDLFLIFKELTRIAKNKALIVVNDYNPLSSYQTERSHLVEELFRIENAVSYLANGEPILVWYPSEYTAGLLELLEWKVETIELLYDKTPWEKELLKEHLEVIEEECKKINNENLAENLLHQAIEILNQVGESETIYAGTIYSLIAKRKK